MSRADSWKRLQQLKRIQRHTLPKLEKSKNRPWRGAVLTILVFIWTAWIALNFHYVKTWWGQYFSGLGR